MSSIAHPLYCCRWRPLDWQLLTSVAPKDLVWAKLLPHTYPLRRLLLQTRDICSRVDEERDYMTVDGHGSISLGLLLMHWLPSSSWSSVYSPTRYCNLPLSLFSSSDVLLFPRYILCFSCPLFVSILFFLLRFLSRASSLVYFFSSSFSSSLSRLFCLWCLSLPLTWARLSLTSFTLLRQYLSKWPYCWHCLHCLPFAGKLRRPSAHICYSHT